MRRVHFHDPFAFLDLEVTAAFRLTMNRGDDIVSGRIPLVILRQIIAADRSVVAKKKVGSWRSGKGWIGQVIQIPQVMMGVHYGDIVKRTHASVAFAVGPVNAVMSGSSAS